MIAPARKARTEILDLLAGRPIHRVPCFSGLINITQPGLDARGLRFSEIHTDPVRLARAAATSVELFGLESAVAPADLCVEAGAFGAEVDFRQEGDEPLFPTVAAPLAAYAEEFPLTLPRDFASHPRLVTACEALRLLRGQLGERAAVGGYLPGPLTLAMYLVDLDNLYADLVRAPQAVARLLDLLVDALMLSGAAYRSAGADFLTVHEMGGSPGVIGPRAFERLVLPRLQRLFAGLPAPRVLSICGDTNRAIERLGEAGAEAVSVDQKNDLARSRRLLPQRVRLLGNLDPVAVLAEGTSAQVRRAVHHAIAAGVDAVWPGCDLPVRVPAENLRALVEETSANNKDPAAQ